MVVPTSNLLHNEMDKTTFMDLFNYLYAEEFN